MKWFRKQKETPPSTGEVEAVKVRVTALEARTGFLEEKVRALDPWAGTIVATIYRKGEPRAHG